MKAFQALSDPTRLAVFQCIRCCDDEYKLAAGCNCEDCQCEHCTCCVPLGDVKEQVTCSASTLTHHLNILRDAELIETDRRGREQFVRARRETLEAVIRFLQERPITCSTEISMEAKSYVNK